MLSTFHFLFNLFLEANAEILKKIRCFFGRFEGMLKIPKCPFKINWPLNTKVDFNYFSDRNVCNNFTFNPRCLTSKLDSHASAILVLQKYFHLIALWHKSKAKNETMNKMNESHAWNFEVSKAHKGKALGIRYAQGSLEMLVIPDVLGKRRVWREIQKTIYEVCDSKREKSAPLYCIEWTPLR